MGRPLKLEVFEYLDPADASSVPQHAVEEVRLAAYESGYTAGWDDAAAANGEAQGHIRAELGANLQEMAFTYLEARGHVMRSLEPLLRDMVAKVLPEIGRATLGQMVLEAVMPLAAELADAPLTLVLNPASRTLVEPLVVGQSAVPVVIREEPTMGEGQVVLKTGVRERRIDLDDTVARIGSAIDGYFHIEPEAKRHG